MSMYFLGSVWLSERIAEGSDSSVTLIHSLSRDVVMNARVRKLTQSIGLGSGLREGASTR
jgi:hypothetical protein